MSKPFPTSIKGDTTEVGGKNASLGEMLSQLKKHKIAIPDGFATTAQAYWKFLDDNKLRDKLQGLLKLIIPEWSLGFCDEGFKCKKISYLEEEP